MIKSRYVIIFAAFFICVLLFSIQWKIDATPATAGNSSANNEAPEQPGNIFVPAELYEKVNRTVPEEVYSLFSSVNIEFNKDLYSNNELIQANLYQHPLQKSEDEVYILELSQSGVNWHYIILQGNAEASVYKGSIVLPGKRTNGNNFRIVEDLMSETVWIVMRELVGSGTGFAQYDEVWYRISNRSIVKDLQYIIKTHQWMSLSQLVFYTVDGTATGQSHVNMNSSDASGFYIDVQYRFQFFDSSALTMDNEWDAFLFGADRKIRYVWNADAKRFNIDGIHSDGDSSLFDFSKQGLRKNFRYELEKMQKSDQKVKQDWLEKAKLREIIELQGREIVDNLNTIEIMNLNDEHNATVVLTLPEGFSVRKLAFPKAPNFEYRSEKNKAIDTVYSFEIHSTEKTDSFRFYGTDGLAGWFYDTSYYRNKPEDARFPSNSMVKAKVYEGETVLGKGEIFILECDILQEEVKTDKYSTYELIFAWIPIENEDLAYNLTLSVPLGEESEKYAEMVKSILQVQDNVPDKPK
jgi:hypothetical protein